MNKRTIISLIILLIGEALIIAGFIHFWPEDKDQAVMVIDIIATSLIWILLSYDMFIPLVDISKKQPRQIATLGVRWYFVATYGFLAFLVMVLGYYYDWSAFLQGFLQVICLMVIIGGMAAASHAGDQVERVAIQEEDKLAGRASMSMAIQQLKDELTMTPNASIFIKNKVDDFTERMRFITPNNSFEAKSLEQQFCELCDTVRFALNNVEMNEEAIKANLTKMELTLNNRKKLLS